MVVSMEVKFGERVEYNEVKHVPDSRRCLPYPTHGKTLLGAVFFDAVDEYLAGVEVVVQQNHIGREAWGDFAQTFQA